MLCELPKDVSGNDCGTWLNVREPVLNTRAAPQGSRTFPEMTCSPRLETCMEILGGLAMSKRLLQGKGVWLNGPITQSHAYVSKAYLWGRGVGNVLISTVLSDSILGYIWRNLQSNFITYCLFLFSSFPLPDHQT